MINGFSILLWLKRMDFHPIHDVLLADSEPTQNQIDDAFRQNPTARRVLVNRKPITRAEWRKDYETRKEKKS